jgi:hypothetical protein
MTTHEVPPPPLRGKGAHVKVILAEGRPPQAPALPVISVTALTAQWRRSCAHSLFYRVDLGFQVYDVVLQAHETMLLVGNVVAQNSLGGIVA